MASSKVTLAEKLLRTMSATEYCALAKRLGVNPIAFKEIYEASTKEVFQNKG